VTQKPKRKNSDKQTMMIIGGVIAAALVVAAIFIVVSSQSSFSSVSVDYSEIPQGRLADGGFVLGNPDAPVTIVAFEDFLCPHCQRYKSTTEQFIDQYVATGLARFEYRFLPAVDRVYSPQSAKLAECSEILKPGSFWNAHDVLFDIASSSRFNNSSARTFADRMDIPYTDILECLPDANQVEVDTAFAQQIGASGTPTVMVRYGDSRPQFSQFGQQPTFEQLGLLVETASP